MIGQTISHYRIVSKLGQGGMGEVWLAEDTRLGHQVAIKKLPAQLAQHAELRRRFEREARAVASLRHPYIVPLYEYDEVDGGLFLVTEYLSGGSLREQVRVHPAGVPLELALRWGIQAAEGLAEAHDHGILHRDLKPDNFLLSDKGELRIADFGLAHFEEETRVTQTGAVLGTLGYMSPEQVRGQQITAQADMFALGATLYEILTGKSPFTGNNQAATLHAILNDDPVSISSLRSEVPTPLSQLVSRMLAKDPSQRPVNADAVAETLRDIAGEFQYANTMPLAVPRRAPPRRGRRAMIISTLVLVTMAVTFGVWNSRGPDTGQPSSGPSERVAVFPFSVGGGEDWMSEGIADLLSSKLDDAGDLTTVDAHTLLATLRNTEGNVRNPEVARNLALALEAGYFILGNAMQVGGELHMDASMYDCAVPGEPIARAEADGSSDDLLNLASALSIDLMKIHMGTDLRNRIASESIHTTSYPALKAFMKGEQLWRQQQGPDSTPFYEEAVAADSTFALAWLRLSIVYGWKPAYLRTAEDEQAAARALKQALELRDHLSTRHQLWLDAWMAFLAQDYDQCVLRFAELVARHPDDATAWCWMGGIKVIFNLWRNGESVVMAKPDLERALELDPDYAQASYYSDFVGMAEADGILEGDGPYAIFAGDDLEAQSRLRAEWATWPDGRLGSTDMIATFSKNLPGAESMTELRLAPTRHPETRGVGHLIMAMLIAAQGQWDRATQHFDASTGFTPDLALQYQALLAGTPFLDVPREEILAIRSALEDWDAQSVPAPETNLNMLSVHSDLHPQIKLYLDGLLSLRLGELERASHRADELARAGETPRAQRLAKDLAHSLRAQHLWQQGDREPALAEFEKAEIKAGYEDYMFSLFLFQSLDRYLRAELLLEMGREEEALHWFGSFAWCMGQEYLFMPHSDLRRGQINDRLGNTDEARKRYQRFVDYWADADPRFQPQVNEVRERLESMTGPE